MKKAVFVSMGLMVFGLTFLQSQCLAPLEAESPMPPNPVNNINGVFNFDYKIKADVKFTMSGRTQRIEMDYYVNSADGSILFPSGFRGFFNVNFGSYEDNRGRIDGAIWLANGQMVNYFFDKSDGKKRAVTRKIRGTAEGRFENDYRNIVDFFNSAAELAEHPEPMPSHIVWSSITEGYKGQLVEAHTGITNTVEIYFDTNPTTFKTSVPMVGFMVGIMKDTVFKNCNRLAVYTKVNIGGDGSSDSIQAELRFMRSTARTFDATEYKPTYIGGETGTDINAAMQDFNRRLQILSSDKENFKERRKLCRDNLCRERMNREIQRIEDAMKRLECEAARNMGMEHLADDCE
ncbi:hypothetical protein [Flagellimonas sp.]|uniref:hypothetical protein n=1 Tax=Flagellimonas sp. TaxID=2058762 RepID=UPI003F49FAE4